MGAERVMGDLAWVAEIAALLLLLGGVVVLVWMRWRLGSGDYRASTRTIRTG